MVMQHQVWYRVFTNLVFDAFIRSILLEHSHLSPTHATLHITREEAMVYIQGNTGDSLLTGQDDLRDWAFNFIASEVFNVDPDDLNVLYLDGAVGSQEAYLHLAGEGILISSGKPMQKGNYQ
jgi:hypothetical protein